MIHVDQAHLHVTAGTHAGRSGKNNEDSFAVSAHRMDDGTPSVLAVISDGIGGHRAGEVASELAVNTVSQVILECDGGQPQRYLAQAFAIANERIFAQAQADDGLHGMGATCSCAWVIGNQLYTVSAGDSRIYLVRDHSIQQLTVDHTWVQEAMEKGLIHPSLVQTHPNLHVIRRYLGSEKAFDPDFRLRLEPGESDERSTANQGVTIKPGDLLLLCTDGLTDLLDEKDILATLLASKAMNAATHALIALANQRGGHDNITVVMLMVPWQTAAFSKSWIDRLIGGTSSSP
jgi:serine/threonine protein phosphatase PrpC